MVAEAVRPKSSQAKVSPEAPSHPTAIGTNAREAGSAPALLPRATGVRRFAALNFALALLLLAEAIAETIVYGAPEDLIVVAPFVAMFAWYGRRLATDRHDSVRLLRTSGVSCAVLAGLCGLATVGAATSHPVDVACIVMSTAVGLPLGGSAMLQLRRSS